MSVSVADLPNLPPVDYHVGLGNEDGVPIQHLEHHDVEENSEAEDDGSTDDVVQPWL